MVPKATWGALDLSVAGLLQSKLKKHQACSCRPSVCSVNKMSVRVLVHADLPLLCAHTVDREKLTPLAVLVGGYVSIRSPELLFKTSNKHCAPVCNTNQIHALVSASYSILTALTLLSMCLQSCHLSSSMHGLA